MKLIGARAMQAVDEKLIHQLGFPETVLIENAGRAVAEAADTFLGGAGDRSVVVLSGKGNNGGDGLAAARFLAKMGAEVTIVLAEESNTFGPGAALELKMAETFGLPVLSWVREPEAVLAACRQSDLLLDGLLGTRFHGSLREPILSLIRSLQHLPVPVIAIDIPSGVEADTGRCGDVLSAQATVTMIAPKPGLYFYPGASHTGDIVVADLNTPDSVIREADSSMELLSEEQVQDLLPIRPANSHKGMNGKIALIAGSEGYLGAAELSSRAAVRAGGGLVTLYTHPDVWKLLAIKMTEVMVRPEDPADPLNMAERLKDCDVVAAGPGVGKRPDMVNFLRVLLPLLPMPVVLDADGLNALAGQDSLLLSIPQKVFTPHPGEMARLLGVPTSDVLASPVESAVTGAKRWQAVVVLKCAPTVIALPDGRVFVNSTGNEGMATGGCGDVLTGTIAALVGQGLSPAAAACCGVYLHGLAGDLAAEKGKIGLKAGDLVERLPEAIARVLNA
jgi:hydroxyethylthiazole kinase-like uncharacterized protein yjeF